jgi:hypothetical protein
MIINKIILQLIIILHVLCVLFIVFIPFLNINCLLILHITIVPFIIFHWVINNNTCCLTIAEQHIRYKLYNIKPNPSECFVYKFIAPVYDFKKNNEQLSTYIYIITITLWCISIMHIYKKYKSRKIHSFINLFEFK